VAALAGDHRRYRGGLPVPARNIPGFLRLAHDKSDRALYMKTRTRHPPGFWRWSGPLSGNSGGPAISSEGLDARRRRLLFRSWHRGIREMDLVYGRFADAEIANLSDTELDFVPPAIGVSR
jgi:hypothetical protein